VAELTQEIYDALPDAAKQLFEKSGDGYRPVAEGKLAELKVKMNDLDGKFKTTDSQLREILAKHEDDRTKAEQAALERLKKEGKIDEILADHERRANESKAQYEARIEKLAGAIKSKERSLIVGEVAKELKVFDDSSKLFSKMILDRIDVDPETGKVTFLDENGGATSLDKAGFIAELAKDSAYDRLRQANVATGGNANGNNGTGGDAAKKFTEYTGAELKALRASKPAEYERLLNEHKGTEA